MPITTKETKNSVIFEISEEYFQLLQKIMQEWNFKDHKSFMKFAIASFSAAEDTTISVKMGVKKRELTPYKNLSNIPLSTLFKDSLV